MCKKDLCEQIIACVANVTDVSVADIKSSNRRPELVDARYLSIYVMHKKGVQPYRIAEYMTMTERNVYHVLERFEDRRKYGDPMIESYYNSVLKTIETSPKQV